MAGRSQRTERVGQQLHEMLASLLLREVADPRLHAVQLTGVDVTPDLKFADVYYVVIDRDDPEPGPETRRALQGSGGYLRKMLGDRLHLKYVPELRFHYDESIERGRRIEAILDAVRPEDEDGTSEEE